MKYNPQWAHESQVANLYLFRDFLFSFVQSRMSVLFPLAIDKYQYFIAYPYFSVGKSQKLIISLYVPLNHLKSSRIISIHLSSSPIISIIYN